MIRNFIFFIVTVAALVWIGYAGLNLVNFSEKSNPEKLFGLEDGRIFILNRPQEIQIEETDFQLQNRLFELYGILSSTMQFGERIFVSEKKAHILLQASQLLSEKEIMSRFNRTGMKSIGAKIYQWKIFKISFHKGIVDCQIESEKTNFNTIKWDTFDKKSSCSIIEFDQKKSIINDYYQQDGVTSIYTRKPLYGRKQISCNDQELFSRSIPSTIKEYQFSEKNYLSNSDPVFKDSKAFEWTKTGVVFFEYNATKFLLMDVFDIDEPEHLLEAYRDTLETNFAHYTGVQLTENFPSSKSRGFYMSKVDNNLLVSEVSSALAQAEVALDMNQSLATNKPKLDIIFSQTPKMVNARSWSAEGKFSRSVYQGVSITTQVKSTKAVHQKLATEIEVENYAMKSSISDFIVHEHRDLVFATSIDNSIAGFKDGKNFLYQTIGGELIGNLRWSPVSKNQAVFTSRNKLFVLDDTGKNATGFPLEIPGGVSKGVVCFGWKNQDNYLVTSLDGKFHWITATGEIKKTGGTGQSSISELPKVWVSAKKLFFGFRNNVDFSMVEAEKGTEFRKFTLPKNTVAVANSNELNFYAIEGQHLMKIDQKGQKSKFGNLQTPIWIKTFSTQKSDGFYLKDGNEISYYNHDGISKIQVKIPVENIDYLNFDNTLKKGMILGVVDGINNQLKLFQPNGTELTLLKNKAQKKYAIGNQNQAFNVYTIVDKFVIHYVL